MIRILMVDDHAALREPLALMLEQHCDIRVVAQAGAVAEATSLLTGGAIADVAVVDLNLPDGNGCEVIRAFLDVNPDGSAMVLTARDDVAAKADAVCAGALGVLHKSDAPDRIVDAVRRLHRGETIFSPGEIISLLRFANERKEGVRNAHAAIARLTPREREVIQVLAEGLSDREVAARLFISSKTVRIHVANILEKLELDSRLQVVLFAGQHGLIEMGWNVGQPPPGGQVGRRAPGGRLRADPAA